MNLTMMDNRKAKGLLRKYNIPLPREKLVQNINEALQFAKDKYPVAMKVSSKEIIHKSDIGCVRAGIKDSHELKESFKDILYNAKHHFPGAKIEGMLVQEQKEGYEVIIGMKNDECFGPVIMFGLGGVFVEVMKDVSFSVTPVSKKEALEMISSIKGYKILQGLRGMEPANIGSLKELISNLSKLSDKENNIQEIDLNPVIVDSKGAYVVDARVMLDG